MERALLTLSLVFNVSLAAWLLAPSTSRSPARAIEPTTSAFASRADSPSPSGMDGTTSENTCGKELASVRAEIRGAGAALRQIDEANMKRVYEGGEPRPATTKAVARILGDVVDIKAVFECHDVVCYYELAAPAENTDPVEEMIRHPWSSALFEREQFGRDGVWARLRDGAPDVLNGKEALEFWLGIMTSTSSLSQKCGPLPSSGTLVGSVDATGTLTASATGVDAQLGACIAAFVAAHTPPPLADVRVAPATASVPLVPTLPNAVNP